MKSRDERFQFRRAHTRRRLDSNLERPRLSVHRSARHLYAQIINDLDGRTVAFVSSLSKELKGQLQYPKNVAAAEKVGALLAKKALQAGVKKIRFDRGGHLYHGRVKAVADAARKAGLEF